MAGGRPRRRARWWPRPSRHLLAEARDHRAVDLVDPGRAAEPDQREELAPDQLEVPDHAGLAAGREPPRNGAAQEHGARPERQGLHDVAAAPDAAVEIDLDLAIDRVDHLGQRVE